MLVGDKGNGKHCRNSGREVDAGKVEASRPIRGEVKQMTPDTGWRRQKFSNTYWIPFSPKVSFNQVPNVNITNINQVMEVKWLLSRSVTLGQAGRFHMKWTSWNVPGGPQCPAVKHEPAASPSCRWSADRGLSLLSSSVVGNQMHWGPGVFINTQSSVSLWLRVERAS